MDARAAPAKYRRLMRILQWLVGLALAGLLIVFWLAVAERPPLRHEAVPRTMRPATTDLSFGKSQPLEAATLDDALRHPIWVWALDEETVEGQDETWQKPVVNTTDVGKDLALYYPIITFRVVGTALYGSGGYDHAKGLLSGLSIWQAGQWRDPRDIAGVTTPVTFEAVPTIMGKAGVRFSYETLGALWARRID